jgi:hypothetical protein
MIGSSVVQAPAIQAFRPAIGRRQGRMDGAEFRADRALAAKIAFGYLGHVDLRCKYVTGIVFRGTGSRSGDGRPRTEVDPIGWTGIGVT